MKQRLLASFIIPATNNKHINNIRASLNKHFIDYELIPIFHATSFFDAWRIGVPQATYPYIILTHQDTEFMSFPDLPELFKGKVGLIGLAGSKIITKRHPWWFHMMRRINKQLSGVIYYRICGLKIKNTLGPFGRVVVLDGVCLITTKKMLLDVGIPDIPWAAWDFYDHIISMEFQQKGYQLITAPIRMIHRKLINIKRREFLTTQEKFVKKYFARNSKIKVE